MIDRIIEFDGNGNPIWMSDIEWWETYIGMEQEDGTIIMFEF